MDSLKKICLENNKIGDRGAISLAKCLEENDTLLSIYLENNGIGRDGAVALGEMFSNKFKLSKLNVNNNPIGDEGFKSIANGLAEIETLRNFTIADCGLTHASIPFLSKCLTNKRFMTQLVIDNNRIGTPGAKLLADGIKDNETMTDLRIANCQIGEEGAIAIA